MWGIVAFFRLCAGEEADMFDPASVRFSGPLAPHVDGFWSDLIRRGYAPFSAANLLRVAAHFSRWLAERELRARDLTVQPVVQFAAHRRRRGYTHFLTPRALEPLLGYLRRVGVAPAPSRPVETSTDRFVRDYSEFLTTRRGLAAPTVRAYTDFARRFIDDEFGGQVPDWPRALDAAWVTGFVSREFPRWTVDQCKRVVTCLRALLRYLHLQGELRHDLAACVPAVAGWRLASLPAKGIEPEQLSQLLASCDSRSLVGARDRAVLCLLARLGLRAGEVAALRLTDIDWRAGEVIVRGKPRRESRLPLPLDVGKAVVRYLRLRPSVAIGAMFLSVRAPHRPITSAMVSGLTRYALRAIGVTTGSAHVLRHTAATLMLRHGASLPEIGHVLRHRHLDTTTIYAKVDCAALRTLVQPWPGGVA